jgi:predicted ester cyclase
MPENHNLQVVRGYFGLSGPPDWDDLIDPEFVNHAGRPEDRHGVEGMKRTHEAVRGFSSDQHYTIEDLIADEDEVWARVTWQGTHDGELRLPIGTFPASGKPFSVGHVHIFRLAAGKIVEHWAVRDDLSWLRQLGIIP